MIKILKNPSYDSFLSLLRGCKSEVLLCAPYIKKDIVKAILKNTDSDVKLKLITKSWLPDFIAKSSDIEAIEMLLNNNVEVYNFQKLHAKTYVFDRENVIITSSNLTNNGLRYNHEYGVIISEDKILSEVINDYFDMINDEELCGKFKLSTVKYIKERIKNAPPRQREIIDDDGELLLQPENKKDILKSLSSWQKDVFEVVDSLPNSSFAFKDLLKFIDALSKKHPKNNNVEAKIRQQLQLLRDKGLIMFVSRGNYKKIWK